MVDFASVRVEKANHTVAQARMTVISNVQNAMNIFFWWCLNSQTKSILYFLKAAVLQSAVFFYSIQVRVYESKTILIRWNRKQKVPVSIGLLIKRARIA